MPPVFAHGALRLYLLALLEAGPKHGYDLMLALRDRFGGTYSPSAGTIYPRLGKLQEEGLVATEAVGRRTNYRITDAGMAELNRRREELAGVETGIAASVRRLAGTLGSDVRGNMLGISADLAAAATAALAGRPGRDNAAAGPDAQSEAILRGAGGLLQAFQEGVLADLRRQAAAAPLDPATLDALAAGLRQARAAVRPQPGATTPAKP